MCGWVKANSLSSHSYMLAVGNNATGKQAGIGFTNANKLFLSTYASPIVYSAASSTLITTNKWIHLAASYDGSTDYVIVGDHANWDFGTGDFTVEFWVRLDSGVADGWIFGWD